jgi:hypothetical protein
MCRNVGESAITVSDASEDHDLLEEYIKARPSESTQNDSLQRHILAMYHESQCHPLLLGMHSPLSICPYRKKKTFITGS